MKRETLDETALGSLVQAEIAAALDFDRSEFRQNRVRALEYMAGEMNDLPYEEGRSSVSSRDVADTIGWLLPGLMRVFFSSDQLAVYEPEGPEDEAAAQQATDFVNFVVMRECAGYQHFWDAFSDCLLHGNGILKHWWDTTPKVTTHVVTGMSEDAVTMLLQEPGIDVVEHSQDEYAMHGLKFTRTYKGGCPKIMAIPPEEFLISREATDIETARFVGHRTLKTRSELIEMGFDRDLVDSLPSFGSLAFDSVAVARRDDVGAYLSPPGSDRSTEEVEVVECYLKADQDGDGVAEMLRVVVGGDSNSKILDWEVWEDEVPFTDFVAERVPHRWEGRSTFDDVEDIQRVKTILLRQFLDNLYQSNVPERIVDENRVRNPDSLFERSIGNVIRVDGDPNTAVVNVVVPFVAKEAMLGLEYADQIVERRTGVSRSTMALDMEALQNQSATAVNAQQTAAYSKVELIARNFAEMGFKRFFKCMLKLIVAHQDRPKTIRLRNQWVEFDPRSWNAGMDCTINVGLGSGSRDRDMAFLNVILTAQRELLAAMGGPSTPYGVKLSKATHHSLSKLVELAGLKSPELYFPELTDGDLGALAEAAQKSDPKLQVEMQKLQLQATKQQAEIALEERKMLNELALREKQITMELNLKERQLVAELALKERLGMANAAMKGNGSGGSVHVGGEPG